MRLDRHNIIHVELLDKSLELLYGVQLVPFDVEDYENDVDLVLDEKLCDLKQICLSRVLLDDIFRKADDPAAITEPELKLPVSLLRSRAY